MTFWNSLEHMPVDEVGRVLGHISRFASPAARVLVCVPNNHSFQYRMFGKDYAYYDPANHLHQFSPRSLGLLMARFGFERSRLLRSWPYAVFAYLQGFLNKLNVIHNYMYARTKRGSGFDKNKTWLYLLDCYNYVLGALLMVPSVGLSLIDLLFPERGGVITVCFSLKKK